MKPAHTFDSVVMELVTGLRSGEIALETPVETLQSPLERKATASSAEFIQPLSRDWHRNKSKGD
jgi:hypothetical protein